MDSTRFFKIFVKMCGAYPDCEGCPLGAASKPLDWHCDDFMDRRFVSTLNIVEKWLEDHPDPFDVKAPDAIKDGTPDHPTPSVAVGRGDILDKAKSCVCQDRNREYGEPEDGFRLIAALWEPVIRASCVSPGAVVSVDPETVALLMALLKVARAAQNPAHLDSWIDLAGYAACGGEIACEGGK